MPFREEHSQRLCRGVQLGAPLETAGKEVAGKDFAGQDCRSATGEAGEIGDGAIRKSPVPCLARVVDADAKKSLSWERYAKLNRLAQLADKFLRSQKKANQTILDISMDGALALFLPQYEIYVLPWGGEKIEVSADFDLVIAGETLDHCPCDKRELFLRELAALGPVLLTYIRSSAHEALRLVWDITESRRLGEILKCGPVEDSFITETMAAIGYQTSFFPHTSTAAWISFAALRGLNSDAGDMLSRYLIEHLEEEESKHPLYQVVLAHS